MQVNLLACRRFVISSQDASEGSDVLPAQMQMISFGMGKSFRGLGYLHAETVSGLD